MKIPKSSQIDPILVDPGILVVRFALEMLNQGFDEEFTRRAITNLITSLLVSASSPEDVSMNIGAFVEEVIKFTDKIVGSTPDGRF